MQVWNRAQQKLTQEPVVGEGAMRFVYETAFGRMLAKGILCRKPISNLYGVLQRSRLTRGKVRRFIRQYDISLEGCTKQEFSSFNDFFTRQRLPRPDTTAPICSRRSTSMIW